MQGTAANCAAFLPRTLAFSAKTPSWPCNLTHERYNCTDSGSKKEIPASMTGGMTGFLKPAKIQRAWCGVDITRFC